MISEAISTLFTGIRYCNELLHPRLNRLNTSDFVSLNLDSNLGINKFCCVCDLNLQLHNGKWAIFVSSVFQVTPQKKLVTT
jgi:hypothetical protein